MINAVDLQCRDLRFETTTTDYSNHLVSMGTGLVERRSQPLVIGSLAGIDFAFSLAGTLRLKCLPILF